MREEVIFRMESAYREDFEVKSYHFGGPEKTMCIIGNMRGNEIQQLYIAGQMVRTLKRFEEEGRFIRRHGVTVIPCANPYSVNVGKRFWAMDNSDINRMYPGYNKGETTQRIAAGIFEKIQGQSPYKSPTDMGVNMAGNCIVDDEACRAASKMEILRRYYTAKMELVQGKGTEETVRKLELVMQQGGVTPDICPAVAASLEKAETTGAPAGAMVLPDGRVITGKTSGTLGAAAALLLNALKALGGIGDQFELISKQVLEPVCHLKTTYLDHRNPRLHTDEVLLTLAISALTNPLAALAKQQLPGLRGSEAHFSVIISEEDLKIFKRLGVRVSCEPKYETKKLYHR